MMEVHLKRRTVPWMFGVLVASFVLAALPVAVSPNPVYNAYFTAPSYQSPYEPSYQPAYSSYEPNYQPAPAYQPAYQPAEPAYQPAYQAPEPAYPQPAYEQSYQPAYQPAEPAYPQPTYEQSYQPAYQPAEPAYQPAYQPAEPAYQPAYQPAEPAYQPRSYEPSYEPAYPQPTYEPSYQPAYEPAYPAPSYPTPSYKPSYEPAYQPPQPSYQPAYEPSYPQPSYEPSYQPAPDQAYPSPAYTTPAYKPPSYEPAYQPKPAYQPAYEPQYQPKPSYQPAYEPSYPTPSYKPAYEPSYPTPSYKPSYEPSYPTPSYKPSYEPEYQPKPAYQPAYQAYAPPTYKTEYYPEYVNYEAITYRDLNESIHCGIIPAVNSELYKNSYGGYQYQADYGYGKASSNSLALTTPTLPFGNYPWTVLVTDDYNNILCQGTIVNARFVLTLSSCVDSNPLHKLRIRYGDWDIRNDDNEYEAYKNVESRICRKFPVTCPSAYPAPSYGYQQKQESETGLTLLEAEFEPEYDEYPQVRAVCLPEFYSTPSYQPAYKAPAYQPSYNPTPAPYSAPAPYSGPSYQPPQPAYQPSTYAAAPYVPPPTYNEPTYVYYSECYVAGYYGSPTTKLQNHKRPTPYEGYGYQAPPTYPGSQPYNSYSHESYDSKIPKVAKVKQIKCENYGGYRQPAGYGYGQQSCEENMCFVGVDGDACVADYGSAVICLIPEKESYDAGYSYYSDQYGYPSYPPPTYQASTYSSSYPQSPYYRKEIRANTAQDKVDRKRAAIVAVVETPAQCSSTYKPQNSGYGYQAQEYQSKPIVAIKVTEKVVNFILEKFFEGAEDYSCPALTNYYQEPVYSEPAYKPAYTPSYQPPAYPTPSYQAPPLYPSYKPAY